MRSVSIRRESRLSAEMELLRARVLGYEPGSTRDHFDARSSHVVAYADGEPIGMVRETLSSPSLLACWARKRWPLPTGSDVVELTRGVVAPAWRGYGIYRLLMLEVLAALAPETVRTATAAIEPDFVGRRFLEGVGFRASGDGQFFRDEPRSMTFVVPIVAPVDAVRHERWAELLVAWRQRLSAAGLGIQGTAGPEASPLVRRDDTADAAPRI
jgi:hypothetical protein